MIYFIYLWNYIPVSYDRSDSSLEDIFWVWRFFTPKHEKLHNCMKVQYQQGATMMGAKGERSIKSQEVPVGRRFGLDGFVIRETFTQRDQGLSAALFEWWLLTK